MHSLSRLVRMIILSAYDDYIPINNSMAIQHFLIVITLRMTHGLYRIHTSDWTRKRQNNGVGIYEYMLTCVAFGVNHTVDLHVFSTIAMCLNTPSW